MVARDELVPYRNERGVVQASPGAIVWTRSLPSASELNPEKECWIG